jgi:polyisoprenoid-binding protein YceI
MKKILTIMALMAWIPVALADVETYDIDPAHSFANFTIRHVVSKASGTFNDVSGKIAIDYSDLAKSSVRARIGVMSVNTGFAKRDEHLREKPEYLEPTKFAEMTFVSSRVEARGKNEGVITGQLTLHGVSREITLPFKLLGVGADPWGGQRAGFEAHTTLNAADYGFGWAANPNGPVGTDIEVTLLIEGVKEKTK